MNTNNTNNIKAIKNGKIIEYLKYCVECGTLYTAVMSNSLACSDRCKQRITRKKKANKPFLIQKRDITPGDLKRFKFHTSNVTIVQ